ncbi:MAG: electron transfer flavoprotein subunit alpha/FixB family protein [Bacteroidales bacterium]|jgi:electron transfer flavoprotein alpha subunit
MSVLIYTENWDNQFKKLSFELVSYGYSVAKMMNTDLKVVSIGNVPEEQLMILGKYGASHIYQVDDNQDFNDRNYTKIIEEVAKKCNAELIIFANNNKGKAISSRLSVRLNAAIATGVSKLPISINPFVVYKKVFSGKAFADVELKSQTKIITLAQNSFEISENPQTVNIEKLTVSTEASNIKLENTEKQTGKILLNDAEIVVSGGRGMKSADNWAPLEELAGLLGAATACSRPVSDEGWRPHEEHTGQTGKIIAPNLYFAFGISGATQHIAGVSSSKYIVAINTDKDAPIFEQAQYGIVGDAQKVLPQLIQAVKDMQQK